jgi:ribosomal-protein-alanine N-acetyltransferase
LSDFCHTSDLINNLSIRGLQVDDLDAVVSIETLTSVHPWSLAQFHQSIDQSAVLVSERQVLGYTVISTAADEAEIHNIAVAPEFQGRGLGSFLLDHSIGTLPAEILKLYLEVRVTNFTAIRLYTSRRFQKVGERRDYYRTEYGCEDALVMRLDIGPKDTF